MTRPSSKLMLSVLAVATAGAFVSAAPAAAAAPNAGPPVPCLVVRAQNVTTASGAPRRLVYAGTGCSMTVFDTSVMDDTSMRHNVMGRSEMLSDTCTTGVSGVGIASSGYAALVSAGSEVLYVSLSSSGKMTSTKLPFPAGYAPGRVTNGINQESDSSAPSEMFLVIADNKNSSAADRIVAYTVSEGMATQCGSIEAGTATHDVKVDPLDSSRMLVSDSAGISSFTLDGCVMSDYSPVAAVAGGNDGIDTDGTHVYIAAQGSGMRIVDVSLGQLVGKVAIDGWAGGVKVIGSTALVAADPGLIGINIADPTAPKHEWTCHLPSPGLGWNLDVDREACVAFVADNMGGLQVIHMCGDSSQPVEVLARYGNATSPFSAACLAH